MYLIGPLLSGCFSAKKSGDGGPTSKELELATAAWLKANKPHVLNSKVERVFREHGWRIVWTPPYCPKSQPIELVWGVREQRAGTLHKAGRGNIATQRHLRRGWYGARARARRALQRTT